MYEQAWLDCRDKCPSETWKEYCLSQKSTCGGSLHVKQCENVTDALQENYNKEYKWSPNPAWTAGERCRDFDHFCKGTSLKAGGVFGWLGFAFATVGQTLVMTYLFLQDKLEPVRKFQILVGSLATFSIAWVSLLVSWAIFAGAGGDVVECRVMDASAKGVVIATGKFGDIIKGDGSFGFGFVVGSWCLMTLVVLVVGHRVYFDMTQRKNLGDEAESSM